MRLCCAKRDLVTLSLLFLVAGSERLACQRPAWLEPASYVAATSGPGRIGLSTGGRSAPIFVSARDYPGVVRASNDLRADIGRVTGAEPAMFVDSAPRAREIVIAGTLGKNALIDRLVREKKLNVSAISGRWETFLLQVVEKPMDG